MSKMGRELFKLQEKCGFHENEYGEIIVNWEVKGKVSDNLNKAVSSEKKDDKWEEENL